MFGYEYFKNFLDEENFRYEEKDSFFLVKYQGVNYLAWKNNTTYLQICIIFYDVDESNIDKCLRVANELNQKSFVLKLTVVDNSMWCSYEFIPNETYTSNDYLEIMHVIDRNSDRFIETMQKDLP